MGLLKPKRRKKLVRHYTTLRCTVSGHQVGWCRGLCTPIDGRGLCGRDAPHELRGRTQMAIARHNERLKQAGMAVPSNPAGKRSR